MEEESKNSRLERLLAFILLIPPLISIMFFLVGIFGGMSREIKSLDTYLGLMALAGAYLLKTGKR